MHLSIHLYDKYLLSAYCIPGTAMVAGKQSWIRKWYPCVHGAYLLWEKANHNQGGWLSRSILDKWHKVGNMVMGGHWNSTGESEQD